MKIFGLLRDFQIFFEFWFICTYDVTSNFVLRCCCYHGNSDIARKITFQFGITITAVPLIDLD